MNDRFNEILLKQEDEDNLQGQAEAFLLNKFKNEYLNYEEIVKYFRDELKMSTQEVLNLETVDLNGKIVPIRHETQFKIRKHTKVQIPYIHSHDFYELIFVFKGSCVQNISLQNKQITMTSNQACLVLPSTVHRLGRILDDEIIFKLHIPEDLFQACYPTELDNTREYILFDTISEQAKAYIVKLLDENHNKNQFSQFAIRNYLSLLFVELLREKINYDNDIVSDLYRYLKVNYKDASLLEFAQKMGYNYVYLGKIIKKATNKTFSQMLTEHRHSEVIKRLLNTEMSVAAIAYEVGYTNPTGLYKSFYKSFGMTPIEYRNSIKQ